jgi:ABC-type multidrug transport system fused ATPase/permease subunit
VEQSSGLFSGSILDNILYGRVSIDPFFSDHILTRLNLCIFSDL